jgi:MinD-like ATPase involved in chromosome partitioning or flagellar assembly
VGFASDRRGQGTTTLLGCVALRLAERGERVAMADANIGNPQLASELGLLPEYGWERILADPMPLEELVIESVRQSIALFPLCCPFDAASLPDDFSALQGAMATLREHYGLVLVDLGVPGDALIGRMARVLDTVLLVRDVRSAQPDRVFDLHRMLNRAGVNVAGMIESFVRGG